ncbi:MAG: hypothetical protein NT030_05580 [Candidatus Saganbacteria bacterium]|nr:hypothetical protein [Candidatus Saganbacteria bacterium]
MAASEKILRAFGLIRSEWEYKDNLVAMKCISHLLDRFEAEKYLKVINGNIYYQREQKNIDSFKLIYNTIAQITPFLHKDVKIPDFEEFQRRCEGKCIKSVNDLNNITELPHWGKLRHKGSLIVSPFLNRAAKDIAASILLFWEHQHIFEKTAGKWVDPNNEALVKRAKNFQQIMDLVTD